LGFRDYYSKWVSTLYLGATLVMENNGEMSVPFILFTSIKQGFFLSTYLFILMIHVLGLHVEKTLAFTSPNGDIIKDQSFVNDMTLYLEGFDLNMEKVKPNLANFCKVSSTKINLAKFARIWASKVQ
jgi:hypothetical protein